MPDSPSPDSTSFPARASELQLEQVTLALDQLRHTNSALHETESKLAEMTRDCAAILDRWAKNDERHASAVVELHARLGEWNDLERKLLSESATRIHQFERSLQHEWNAIRQKHEEPIQRLDEQARRITETCLTAIDSALKGFDRAEARLAAIEQQVSRDMSDLSREVRDAIAELRQTVQLGSRQPWSLDNVVRLHNELRAEADDTGDVVLAGSGAAALAPPAPAATRARAVAEPQRVSPPIFKDLAEQTPAPPSSGESDSAPASHPSRAWGRGTAVALATGLALLAGGIFVYDRVEQQLSVASARAAAAEQSVIQTREAARQQLAAAQQSANDRIAAAQDAADRAQRFAALVAAPDVRRLDLGAPSGDASASGHVLWSRSRGIAVTTTGLGAVTSDTRYVVWLTAAGQLVPVGSIAPDASGLGTLVAALPSSLPRPVTGAFITLERDGATRRPSGTAVLTSAAPRAAS